jgi:TonB-linked SusC/RagA family outer membrane protein
MKLSFFICLLAFLQVSAASFAQKISLDKSNATLRETLNDIRKQSGYNVICDADLLKNANNVNVHFKNVSVEDALKQCFTGQALSFIINKNTIVVTLTPSVVPVVKQTVFISGTVTDEKNQPLPGVTIKIKNDSKTTVSDMNGDYKISVSGPDAILVFSFIGFDKKEVRVNDKSIVNVSLTSSTSGLNEVVVIGYNAVKKSDLTASVSSISKEAMSQRTIFSLADAMKGKAAGVQITQNDGTPGSESTIRIRGASSVSASSTPLYVIDGILQDDANNISPGDVESIEILKDASGTSMYGSRGANGVIIITTKMGKDGKTKVELYSNTGVQEPANLYKLMDASQYTHQRYLANYVYSPASTTNANAPANVLGGYTYYRDSPLGTTGGGFWGVPTVSPYSTWRNNTSPDSTNTDWQKAMFQKSLVQEYRLSLLGGNKDTKFAFLGGYLNQAGLLVFSGYQRFNGRFNIQQKLSPSVTLNTNISGSQAGTKGFISSTSALNGGVMSNSIVTSMLQQPPTNKLTYTDLEDNSNVSGYITSNPYSIAKYDTNNRDVSVWTARLGLDWNINSNFMFRTTGTYTNTNSNTDSYYPKNVGDGSKYNGRAILSRGVTTDFQNDNLLYYKAVIDKNNKLNIVAGATFEQNKYSLITAENQNYAIETLGVYGLSNGTVPIIPTYNITKWTVASFLGRAEYSFKDKILATVTMRTDGSSRFSASNKWGYFPSAAVAWKMSEEKFIKNITAISNLKLRTSIGQSGNTAIPSYLTLSTISTYFSPIDGNAPTYGVVVSRPENLSLKWETTTQADAGLDLGLFNDKVTFTLDWYLKTTRDLLIQKATPGYTGYTTTWTNLGSIQNSGLEADISAVLISNQRLSWNISTNIGFNRSKAVDVGGTLNLAPNVISGVGTAAIIQNGQPLGQWYGYKTDGVFQSQAEINASGLTAVNGIPIASVRPGSTRFVDQNGDHVIDANDRAVLGQGQPAFTGGLTNSITYKGFNLNMVIQYSYGNKIYNANRAVLETGRDSHNATAALANSWRPSLYDATTGTLVEAGNPVNQYRMAGSPEQNIMLSDWIEDGSFIRLSDVTLSYQFKTKQLNRIGFSGLTLFSSAKNLLLLTKYSGYDPEVNTRQGGFGDLMPSLDYASYPRSRIYSFGVRAQF